MRHHGDDAVVLIGIQHDDLGAQLADTAKASLLNSDGAYARPTVRKDSKPRSSQAEFMALALGESKARRPGRPARRAYTQIEVAGPPR